jgi:hypothetical protein
MNRGTNLFLLSQIFNLPFSPQLVDCPSCKIIRIKIRKLEVKFAIFKSFTVLGKPRLLDTYFDRNNLAAGTDCLENQVTEDTVGVE